MRYNYIVKTFYPSVYFLTHEIQSMLQGGWRIHTIEFDPKNSGKISTVLFEKVGP
jgi:hypothetical protein